MIHFSGFSHVPEAGYVVGGEGEEGEAGEEREEGEEEEEDETNYDFVNRLDSSDSE